MRKSFREESGLVYEGADPYAPPEGDFILCPGPICFECYKCEGCNPEFKMCEECQNCLETCCRCK